MKEYAKIEPAVNQVEFHPFLYQKELMDYCAGRGIAIEAYSRSRRAIISATSALPRSLKNTTRQARRC